jgi:hypothetical protein
MISKGISDSALPYKRTAPSWLKVSSTDVEEHVCRLSKKGLTPSQIGVHLRDSLGIAQASAGASTARTQAVASPISAPPTPPPPLLPPPPHDSCVSLGSASHRPQDVLAAG